MTEESVLPTVEQRHPGMLDTQVVSYAVKGLSEEAIAGCSISSVVAQEFLNTRRRDIDRLRYPLPSLKSPLCQAEGFHALEEYSRVWRRFPRVHPEAYILEFDADFPVVVEQGHQAIARVVNTSSPGLFKALISGLPKNERKVLAGRFNFLVRNGISCVPLDPANVNLGIELMYEFSRSYQVKDVFRNSLNDILILATSIRVGAPLVTEDKLLARFAVEALGVESVDVGSFCRVSPQDGSCAVRLNRESKEYINRNWRQRTLTPQEISRERPGHKWASPGSGRRQGGRQNW